MEIQGVAVLLLLCITSSRACLIEKVPECQHYELIRLVKFHGFISPDTLDESCSHFQSALSCAYTEGRLHRCNPLISLPFDLQRGVIDAVCGTRREDYMKSAKCFNKSNVKNRIVIDCLSALANLTFLLRHRCGASKMVSDCASSIILMSDGCDSTDAAFMADLVEISWQPNKVLYQCTPRGGKTEVRREKSKVTAFENDVRNESIKTNTSPEPSYADNSDVIKHDETRKRTPQNVSEEITDIDNDSLSDGSQTASSTVAKSPHAREDMSKGDAAEGEEHSVTHTLKESQFENHSETAPSVSAGTVTSMSGDTTSGMNELDLNDLIKSSGPTSVSKTFSTASAMTEPAEKDWTIAGNTGSTSADETQEMKKTSEYFYQGVNKPGRINIQLNKHMPVAARVSKSTSGASNAGSRVAYISSFLLIFFFHLLRLAPWEAGGYR